MKEPQLEGRQILVVDDSPDARNLLRRNLKREGYQVKTASCGAEAIECLNNTNPDLVLLDIMMPDINGVDLLRKIRADEKIANTPVILVSALDEIDSIVDGLREGANDYITKPVSTPVLVARVRTHLKVGSLIRELERQREVLARLAAYDDLTMVSNRRTFEEMLNQEINRSERHNHFLSLLMLDIDHFKAVNDEFGHLVGDAVLVEFARRLSALMRTSDLLGRYGGEEFCVLLPETAMEEARQFSDRCREAIAARSIRAKKQEIRITVSIGLLTVVPDRETTGEQLFEAVDKALYAAKKGGRDQVQIADAPDNTKA